ncbi:hypothetical protein [Curtobacterium sp. MCBD17_003]|uniref:hypothetical protein n=1 Tax=Curtobacterium sp. MCBD17_003 TaxID=2175667 RepID=UPI0011B40BB1|nr:hypothetical protein [Curtobacterium sp. MCBD17_003]WIE53435.1 hypothetical protein DEI88_009705 [Curtobacterium sp. MCBD17_003]
MTPSPAPPTPADRLAALTGSKLRAAPHSGHATKVAWTPDGRRLALPWPAMLARTFATGVLHDAGIGRASTGLAQHVPGTKTAAPLTFAAAATILRDQLRKLPDRADASPVYTDLRTYVLDGDPEAVSTYLLAVVRRAAIRDCPWPVQRTPAEPATPRPAIPHAERCRESRARVQQRQAVAALGFIADTFTDGELGEGERLTWTGVLDLLLDADAAEAFTALLDAQDDPNKRGQSNGSRILRAALDAVLTPRNARPYGRHWIVPDRTTLDARLAAQRAALA